MRITFLLALFLLGGGRETPTLANLYSTIDGANVEVHVLSLEADVARKRLLVRGRLSISSNQPMRDISLDCLQLSLGNSLSTEVNAGGASTSNYPGKSRKHIELPMLWAIPGVHGEPRAEHLRIATEENRRHCVIYERVD